MNPPCLRGSEQGNSEYPSIYWIITGTPWGIGFWEMYVRQRIRHEQPGKALRPSSKGDSNDAVLCFRHLRPLTLWFNLWLECCETTGAQSNQKCLVYNNAHRGSWKICSSQMSIKTANHEHHNHITGRLALYFSMKAPNQEGREEGKETNSL